MAITVLAKSTHFPENLFIKYHVRGRSDNILDAQQSKPLPSVRQGIAIPTVRPRYLVVPYRVSQTLPPAIAVDDNQVTEEEVNTTAHHRADDCVETASRI